MYRDIESYLQRMRGTERQTQKDRGHKAFKQKEQHKNSKKNRERERERETCTD